MHCDVCKSECADDYFIVEARRIRQGELHVPNPYLNIACPICYEAGQAYQNIGLKDGGYFNAGLEEDN